jgi:hypothetical protein
VPPVAMALAHKLNHDGVWGSVSFLSGSPRGCGRLQGFRGKPMMAIVQPGGQKAGSFKCYDRLSGFLELAHEGHSI